MSHKCKSRKSKLPCRKPREVIKPFFILLDPPTPAPAPVDPCDPGTCVLPAACVPGAAGTVIPNTNHTGGTILVTYPGGLSIPSYLDLFSTNNGIYLNPPNTISAPVPIPTLQYTTWCTDVFHHMNTSTTYMATIIPSYDPFVQSQLFAFGYTFLKFNNICALNYILNRASFYTHFLGYTFGDIQTVIWHFMIGTGIQHGSAPFNATNVAAIEADVLANAAKYRPCAAGDYFALFVVPTLNGVIQQLLVTQVTVSQFPYPCCDNHVCAVDLSPPLPGNGLAQVSPLIN